MKEKIKDHREVTRSIFQSIEISTVLNGLLANEILTSLDRTISLILTSEEPSLEKNCLSFYTVANSPISSSWVKLRVLEWYASSQSHPFFLPFFLP